MRALYVGRLATRKWVVAARNRTRCLPACGKRAESLSHSAKLASDGGEVNRQCPSGLPYVSRNRLFTTKKTTLARSPTTTKKLTPKQNQSTRHLSSPGQLLLHWRAPSSPYRPKFPLILTSRALISPIEHHLLLFAEPCNLNSPCSLPHRAWHWPGHCSSSCGGTANRTEPIHASLCWLLERLQRCGKTSKLTSKLGNIGAVGTAVVWILLF